ncbi:MAG TPA: adenylate/guanylate cyclase domain-containing protein [Galbitalea sp.]|nr:adenylate/guanylate cyclase domain-containing protein [Galbitalea sp.]
MAERAGSTIELRVVSVLFADLVNFTTLAETRDAENVRALLDEYFATCRKIVERYGGTLEKFIGDAVMAVWGYPRADEDAAEGAVRAGIELLDTIELPMRVGITTGTVAVGSGESLIAGDVVNLASRIQQIATEGEVWTDQATRDAAARAIEFEPRGEHSVKGRNRSEILHAARAVVGGRGGLGRVDELDVPLVGYRRELSATKDALQATIEGERGRLLVISGESGTGKSRLGRELLSYADGLDQNIRWHASRASALDVGTPYGALESAVRGRMGVTDDNLEQLGEHLDAHLREFFPDAARRSQVRSALAVLLGIGDYDVGQQDLFVAWTAWFAALGAEGDIVVWVLDDANFADELLLAFVEYLVANVGSRMLVVLLARPELLRSRPSLLSTRGSAMIGLEGLSRTGMTELVEKLVDDIPDDLLSDLVAGAGGLPLYAIEVVRGMIDRGEVVVDGGHRSLSGTLSPSRTTPSLTGVVMSRLESLEAGDRGMLQRASVFGLSFTATQLARLLDAPIETTAQGISRLVDKDLLRAPTEFLSGEAGQHHFVQALVQQVAYESLSRQERARLHLRAAEVLSESAADSGLIVEHLLRARSLDDSAPTNLDLTEWLAAAAARAERTAAFDIALRNYDLAIATATDPERQDALRLSAADIAILRSEFSRARTYVEAVTCDLTEHRLHAAIDLARTNQAQGRMSEAIAILAEWPELPDGPIPTALAARWATIQGRVAFEQPRGAEIATRWAERALVYAEATLNPILIHTTLNQYGIAVADRGLNRIGRLIHEEAARLARESGLTQQLAWSLNNLALDEARRGDFPRAIAMLEEVIEINWQWGRGVQQAFPLAAQLEYLTLTGRTAAALELAAISEEAFSLRKTDSLPEWVELLQAIAWARDLAGLPNDPTVYPQVRAVADADPEQLRVVTNALATLAAVDGLPERARLAREACAIEFEATGFADALPTMWPRGADFNLEAGDFTGAASMLEYAPEPTDVPEDRVTIIQVNRIRAILDALDPTRGADPREVERALRTSLDELRSVGLVPDRCRVLVTLAALLDASDRVSEADALRREAAVVLTECGALGLRRRLGLDDLAELSAS